jgi:hypothetical protein
MKTPVRALCVAMAAFTGMAAVPAGASLLGAITVVGAVATAGTAPAAGDSAVPPEGATGPSGPNPIARFARDVLGGLGEPTTALNVDSIVAWAAGEGSCARYNPLDTTLPEPGAVAFNTLADGGHVWNYPSWPVGVQATVDTLTSGRYQPVLDVLRSSGGPTALEGAVRATPWGTTTFGSTTYTGAQCAGT